VQKEEEGGTNPLTVRATRAKGRRLVKRMLTK
jgi:hypothetical protein